MPAMRAGCHLGLQRPATRGRRPRLDRQLRLFGRFRRLAARKHTRQVVVIAVAQELAGFLLAEMTA
jgi:hypothetical protein